MAMAASAQFSFDDITPVLPSGDIEVDFESINCVPGNIFVPKRTRCSF